MSKEPDEPTVAQKIRTKIADLKDQAQHAAASLEEAKTLYPKRIADIQKEISDWETALEALTGKGDGPHVR